MRIARERAPITLHRLLCVLLLACIAASLPMAEAWALGGVGGGQCPGEGLLARIVPCVTQAMEKSTYKLAYAISGYLYPAASAFVVLVIIIYGMKVMSPEGNARKTALPLLIKIAFVLAFVQGFAGFIPAVHGGQKEIVDILANALSISSQCPASGGGGAAASGAGKLWSQMDCILGKLFGFAGKDGNAMLIASVFGLVAGFLFGGSFGMIAFMGVFGLLIAVAVFVFRAAFAFLNGFMLACFCVIISPFFIPLILLMPSSRYFSNWLGLFIGSFLLPLIVVGYCIFALSIFNKTLFESERGETIRKTMDKAFTESITHMRQECIGTLINNIFFGSKAGNRSVDPNQYLRNPSVPNPANPTQSAGQGLCFKVPNIDMQKAMGNFKNKQEFFRKIFMDGAAVFLLAWLLLEGLKAIISAATNIAGAAAGKLMQPISDIEKRLASAQQNAKQKFQDSLRGEDGSMLSGTDFIRRLPSALQGLGSGYFNGLRD